MQALELELDTYDGIVTEMGRNAGSMVATKHPDCKAIASKQAAIQQQMRTLQKLASARQQRLVESMCRHEYFSESADLEQWIKEQLQAASSEDFGQDYEHLLVHFFIFFFSSRKLLLESLINPHGILPTEKAKVDQ